jgi:hypothetical protein
MAEYGGTGVGHGLLLESEENGDERLAHQRSWQVEIIICDDVESGFHLFVCSPGNKPRSPFSLFKPKLEKSWCPLFRSTEAAWDISLEFRMQICKPGDMTAGGILYEGTYEEWLPRINSSCKIQRLLQFSELTQTWSYIHYDTNCECKL